MTPIKMPYHNLFVSPQDSRGDQPETKSPTLPPNLTLLEKRVALALLDKMSPEEIVEDIGLEIETVQACVASILEKMDVLSLKEFVSLF